MAKTPTRKAKTPTRKPKIDEYKVFVKIMGKSYNAKGKTLREALSKVVVKAKGVAVVVVKKGDKEVSRIMNAQQIAKLQLSGLHKEIVLKQVETLFNI